MATLAVEKVHIKNLEWAIWFCQVDLSGLRGGDWINLKEDLYDFVDIDRAKAASSLSLMFPATKYEDYESEVKKEFCDKTTETDIVKIQGELKKRLLGFAYSKGENETELLRRVGHRGVISTVQDIPITNGKIGVQGFKPNEPFLQILSFGHQPNLQAKVDLALFRRLVFSGILRSQLRICPECERIFLIRRKPRTDMTFQCSIRCSRNAATRRYRERLTKENSEQVRSKERERSHHRHVEKQRRKYGPNVKVERRPRKQPGS
jgi:hypothetical protein